MRSFNKIFIFIIVLIIAKLIADQVAQNNYIVILIAFAVFLYMIYTSWNQKVTFLSLTVFIPFVFPTGFPIDRWIEILAPFFAFFLCVEILSNKQTPFPRKAALFLAAVAVLGIWSIVNYISNPVLGTTSFGSDVAEGGIRVYFLIFSGITTFLCSLWFFTYKELNVQRWLWILIVFCLIIGDLRIIGYFQNYALPLVGGAFKFTMYKQFQRSEESQIAIGGLRELAAFGIPLILCILYKGKINIYSILVLINFIAFVILGGGRSNFVGVILAVSLFIIIFKRKYLWPVILSFLILVPIIILLNFSTSQSKFGRIVLLEGGMEQQSSDRYYTYLYMWEVFKTSPVFGKGIGFLKVDLRNIVAGRANTASEKILTKIIWSRLSGVGGHGAYLSTISVFGIGGIFYLTVMLYGGIYNAYKITRERGELSDDTLLALFAFLYLLILALSFVAGGTGYDSFELWFLAGMIAGLKSKERIKDVCFQ